MLRSKLIVIAALIVTAVISLAAVLASLLFRKGHIVRRLAHLWAKILLFIAGTKVEIIGREHVIRGRPQIFMANHQSDFDILIFLAALPVDFLWIVKQELFKVPIFGSAMKRAGYISIDRQNHGKAMQSVAEAAECLRKGFSIATFPEGTRSKEGKLLPFKQGMFYLAIETGAPIIPITLIGSGTIMEKQSLTVNKGKITMVIDAPVEVSGYAIETRAVLTEAVRNIIAANYERYQGKSADVC
jgi:1-acyl-sn-glycerol-3-phosphate acyltransferase